MASNGGDGNTKMGPCSRLIILYQVNEPGHRLIELLVRKLKLVCGLFIDHFLQMLQPTSFEHEKFWILERQTK